MRRSRPLRTLPVALVVALSPTAALAACGGGTTTKAEFVDHAMDNSDAAVTAEQKAALRKIFECVWPQISKDQDTLDEFMDTTDPSPELNAKVSKFMGDCYLAAASTTTAAPTTTAAG